MSCKGPERDRYHNANDNDATTVMTRMLYEVFPKQGKKKWKILLGFRHSSLA
jgi:hypothetical protein